MTSYGWWLYVILWFYEHYNGVVNAKELKLTVSGRQSSRSSWKSDSHINILVPRRRWINILGHVAVAFSCDKCTRLQPVVKFVLNMCRSDIQTVAKKLNLKTIMIVVTYNIRVYFVGFSLPFSVCHKQGLILLTKTPKANFWTPEW